MNIISKSQVDSPKIKLKKGIKYKHLSLTINSNNNFSRIHHSINSGKKNTKLLIESEKAQRKDKSNKTKRERREERSDERVKFH